MCGIAGFVDPRAKVTDPERALGKMAESLAHRGPDDSGQWWDAQLRLGFAHRRLSIIDPSPAGHQPMTSASGRTTIIFNGEVYNAGDLRTELARTRRIAWRGHSDTEVMVEAIEQWGIVEATRRFNGMFAFALFDREARSLSLARDGVGKKPLYYGWVDGVFAFASELKAFAALPGGRSLGVDRAAVAELLQFGCIGSTRCIHPGLAKVAPGTVATLALTGRMNAGAQPQVTAFWSAQASIDAGRSAPIVDDRMAVDEFERVLETAVRRRMVSDVPFGAFLSGGIDSALIVTLMARASPAKVKTFTIGFDEPDYDESTAAAAIANRLGTEHTSVQGSAKAGQDLIPLLAQVYDEPFADSSQIPTLMVSALARSKVRVALSGDGADELLGGYDRYAVAPMIHRALRFVPGPARGWLAGAILALAKATCNEMRPLDALSHLLPLPAMSRRRDKIGRGIAVLTARSPAQMHRALASTALGTDLLVLGLGSSQRGQPATDDVAGARDIATELMERDFTTYLVDDLLVKVDRASMSVGLEVRSPYLDREVAEFAWRMPPWMKIRGVERKWLSYRLAERIIPGGFKPTPKMGFAVPVHDWIRGPLRPWAEDLLSVDRLRREGVLDAERLRARWERFLAGRNDERHLIWALLMFQSWMARIR